MPKRNHGQRPESGRSPGKLDRGAPETDQSTFHQVQEGVAQMGHNLHDRMESMQSGISDGYHKAENTVAQNPLPSVLIGFGLGVGVGLVLTTLFSKPEESWSGWSHRHARDAMRGAGDSFHRAEHAAGHIPNTLHHLADSIRNLPEAIARHLPSALSRHV